MQGTNRSGQGGEKSLLCDPGSELRLGGRENRRAKTINGMEKKKKKKTRMKPRAPKGKDTKPEGGRTIHGLVPSIK